MRVAGEGLYGYEKAEDGQATEGGVMEEFEFTFHKTVIIRIDKALLPDDEWRSAFYDIHTLEEMAKHIAWNYDVMNFSQIEGIAAEDSDKYEIVDSWWD
jgi:hypothetical protein